LFLKLHGRARPISLKTDVIKSRNRVKSAQPKKRDSQGAELNATATSENFPTAHTDTQVLQNPENNLTAALAGEPLARTSSPGSLSTSAYGTHNPNIAPQHIFDTVSLTTDSFISPNLPSFALRQPSPSVASLNGTTNGNGDSTLSYDALSAHNNQLRTRVSELEVINDLFRGRVAQLEQSEQDARRSEKAKDEELSHLQAELKAMQAKAAELEKRFAEVDAQRNDGGSPRKRQRIEDEVSDKPAETHASFLGEKEAPPNPSEQAGQANNTEQRKPKEKTPE
jgi:GATA-binding protein